MARHDRSERTAGAGPGGAGETPGLAGFERLSRLLDTQFALPGVPFRFGLDGLVGLIPGVGDAVTGLMGLYALQIAERARLPMAARAKMIWNIGVDVLVGSIPLVGDLFDFAFHAHRKNWRILKRHLDARSTS